jgi:hypothetical protein
MFTKQYVTEGIALRVDKIRDRLIMYTHQVDELGRELVPGSAAVARSKCKHELAILALVEELISYIEGDFTLSEEAGKGYEALAEPYERHRNFRRVL